MHRYCFPEKLDPEPQPSAPNYRWFCPFISAESVADRNRHNFHSDWCLWLELDSWQHATKQLLCLSVQRFLFKCFNIKPKLKPKRSLQTVHMYPSRVLEYHLRAIFTCKKDQTCAIHSDVVRHQRYRGCETVFLLLCKQWKTMEMTANYTKKPGEKKK